MKQQAETFCIDLNPCLRVLRCLLVAVFMVFACSNISYAAQPVLDFKDDAQADMYLKLTKEYRCLKCQNQNLADSNADLARDLRNEIYEQVVSGKTEDEISTYLVARYGDFVLYKPPFKSTTYLLWLGPFALLLVALWYALRLGRGSEKQVAEPTDEQLARARKMLD